MFLIYVDESGEVRNPADKIFVLGSIAIYENQAFFLTQEFDKIQQKWFPHAQDSIEFHASKMYNGNGEPWHSMPREKRIELLIELCHTIGNVTPKGMSLFGIAIQKDSFPQTDIVEKAFQELCGHTDAFIDSVNVEHLRDNNKQKNRGLMIFDSDKYHGQLDKLLLVYRRTGTTFGRVKNFADAPTFANSSTTRLLQAADIISYAIHRRYEKSDTQFLDKLLNRFHQKDGKIHGLMHLVSDYRQCACPACLSRR